ncbi:hypothetical protein [Daejeonella oryzae]|uniref:hypothetical protein n=1 Tax=Daejeonella oryzae TaxID=1122943 RepID=UPI000400F2CA|nr:hypothetical protein [Daejeonella oryzae]
MKPEKLTDIKKELSHKSVQELTDLCLRLAKYKKENKELLNYLLYDASEPLQYSEKVKTFLNEDFKNLQHHYYYSSKSLRKILRLMNRYIKYTASKQVEIELLLWFCNSFIKYADTRTSHKPLQALFIRQLDKIKLIIPKLHEDLQFDYVQEFEEMLSLAAGKISWINKNLYAIN